MRTLTGSVIEAAGPAQQVHPSVFDLDSFSGALSLSSDLYLLQAGILLLTLNVVALIALYAYIRADLYWWKES